MGRPYSHAADVLVAIQRAAPPPDLPPWDAATMAATALATLFDWWWPAMFGADAPARRPPGLRRGTRGDAGPCRGRTGLLRPSRLLRRQPALAAASRMASAGSACSTSRVPRSAIPPTTSPPCCRMRAATSRRQSPNTPWPTTWPRARSSTRRQFRAAYAACAAQRHLRVAGQWVRLARRDGRPGYLVHGPRTWRLLEQAVREPVAAPLAAALDRWIPPERRGNPPDLAA